MPNLDRNADITDAVIDVSTLPSRVRSLAQRIHSQLGLWPWQLLSFFPSIQRSELNPTYWSIHTIESLSALVTRELEAEAQAQAQAKATAQTQTQTRNSNTSDATITTTRRTRSSRLTETTQAPEVHEESQVGRGAQASRDAVAERIASQLAKAVDDRVRKQTRVSRSGDAILSTPKRPCLTCQDVKKILNVDGDKDQGQDGEGPSRSNKKRRQSRQHEAPQSRRPSEELGEDLALLQRQVLDRDQQDQDQQQQPLSSFTPPARRPAHRPVPNTPVPAFSLDQIDPVLRNSFRPEHNSSPYGPLMMLTEAAAAHTSEMAYPPPRQTSADDGNINVEANNGGAENESRVRMFPNSNDTGPDRDRPRPHQSASPPPSVHPLSQHGRNHRLSTPFHPTLTDGHRTYSKRIRLSSGGAGSAAGSDYGMHGSYHMSDDGDSLVLDLAPDLFIDEHERTATTALTTTSRQETQRLKDETAELHGSLRHLRAKLAEAANTVSSEEPSRRAAEKITKIQQDLQAAEAELKGRNAAEQSLASAIQAAGTSDTVTLLETAFQSYQRETQQHYVLRITSLKATLVRAQEDAAGLDAARLTAVQDKEEMEHGINEAIQKIRMYEKRCRLWTTYGSAIRLGPTNLGRLLGKFPVMEKMLEEACMELDLRGAGVEGELGGSGSGSGSGSGLG